jgi:hypothetical protein
MIHQISPVQTKTDALPKINKGLIQARHIQAQLKERVAEGILSDDGPFWTPIAVAPYFVPVSRRIE